MKLYLLVSPFIDTPEILIFGALMGLALMILSRVFHATIFSILSCGVWLYMMIELAEEEAMIVVMIGLMAEELYHAFFGKP